MLTTTAPWELMSTETKKKARAMVHGYFVTTSDRMFCIWT